MRHYRDIFNCVISNDFSVGVVPDDNVVIRPDDVSFAIEKLALNKSSGTDQQST